MTESKISLRPSIYTQILQERLSALLRKKDFSSAVDLVSEHLSRKPYSECRILHGISAIMYQKLFYGERRSNTRLLQRAIIHFEKYFDLQSTPIDELAPRSDVSIHGGLVKAYAEAILADPEGGADEVKQFLDDLLFNNGVTESPLKFNGDSLKSNNDGMSSICGEEEYVNVGSKSMEHSCVYSVDLHEYYIILVNRLYPGNSHQRDIIRCLLRVMDLYFMFGINPDQRIVEIAEQRASVFKGTKRKRQIVQYTDFLKGYTRLLLHRLSYADSVLAASIKKEFQICKNVFDSLDMQAEYKLIVEYNQRILIHHEILV